MIVTRLKWEDLERLRVRAAAEPPKWFARGPLLLTIDETANRETEIAMFSGADGPGRAALAAEEHNRVVELINIIVMIGRKMQDVKRNKAAVVAQRAKAAENAGGNGSTEG